MSLLAEHYDGGQTRLSSEDVARNRRLSKPLAAKLLSILSTGGLITGTRGPGGGYWLARPPREITLADITARFEKEAEGVLCPFGPGWCGTGDPCPVHDQLVSLTREWDEFLHRTTLDVFATNTGTRRQ